jgi:hypothetical protein
MKRSQMKRSIKTTNQKEITFQFAPQWNKYTASITEFLQLQWRIQKFRKGGARSRKGCPFPEIAKNSHILGLKS